MLKADEIEFYTDATRNFSLGFGGYCGNSWMISSWSDFTASVNPSIEYLELYAVAAAVLVWIRRFQNRRVIIFCDNISVVYMLNQEFINLQKLYGSGEIDHFGVYKMEC